jgi:CDP-glucose 4,6-dehydratase
MDEDVGVMFGGIYTDRRILVTGHTGFKGSWLVYWLQRMGANVCGYSLDAPTNPSHWDLLELDMRSEIADIRDGERLQNVVADFRPDIVFHLAAQPLVRASYSDPVKTYSTNVMGTLNVFEACRKTDSVRAIINVTTDKCYENKEWVWGYRENDPMGGHDPYSSSKGCSELLTTSYRDSFFNNADFGSKHQTLLASCRAGNVIGGGDWAEDRLIPDIMRAVAAGDTVDIRNPSATRPWQHVLEPLSGYLSVGHKLLEGKSEYAEGWNFGPSDDGSISVGEVVTNVAKHWDKIEYKLNPHPPALHEANLLKLDCSKAHAKLGWKPVWNSDTTFERTVNWYRAFYETETILTSDDLNSYLNEVNK